MTPPDDRRPLTPGARLSGLGLPGLRPSGLALSLGALVLSASPALAHPSGSTTGEPAPTTSPAPTATPTDDPSPDPEDTADPVESEPLTMTLDRLTPAALPARGRVTVTGSVSNRSEETWRDLKVYLVTSQVPMTTAEELAAAAEVPLDADVGARLVGPGLFVEVPDLEPGDASRFRLSVPVRALEITGDAGVYWFGTHVLGTSEAGRDLVADGRARTFLPLVPARTPPAQLAMTLQVRNHTVRAADGRLEFLPGWQRALSPYGRLGRLVELGQKAGSVPLTWVVDPAVLEAAQSVARDNPPLGLGLASGPADPADQDQQDGDQEGDASGDEPTRAQQRAAEWVEELTGALTGARVLALPYGDLDLAAAARHDEAALLDLGLTQSTALLAERDITATPAVVPRNGSLPPEAFNAVPDDVPVLLSRDAVGPASPSLRNHTAGGEILVVDPALTAGGPRPAPTDTALAVRQRLLAEAAMAALSGTVDRPLVALLPTTWDPGPGWRKADLFGALDQPWIQPVATTGILAGLSPEEPLDPLTDLRYTPRQIDRELPSFVLRDAAALAEDAETLTDLLTEGDGVGAQVARQALLSASDFARVRPGLAAERARDASERVAGWFDEITLTGPRFVTLSSEDGAFDVTVVNGLDREVVVGLDATVSSDDLRVSIPPAQPLGPGQRTSFRIETAATGIGVHQVVLRPTTESGESLGQGLTLSVRTSKVGLVLWVIMGVGATLLFTAIGVRLVRRVRRRRRTHGPVLSRRGHPAPDAPADDSAPSEGDPTA